MVTPQEIHIAVDLGIQKLGSYAFDNIKPEYIDLVFNRMGNAFIAEKTSRSLNPRQKGLEDTIIRIDDIQELITSSSLTILNSNTKRQYAILPENFLSYVEAEADVIFSCTNQTVTYITSTVPEYVSVIPFKQSNFGSPPSPPFQYTKVYVVKNTVPIEIFDFADYSTGLSSIEEIFTVVDKILLEVNRLSNLSVYWEKYRDLYHPQSFIFVSTDSYYSDQAMTIDYTNSLSGSASFGTTNYTKVTTGSGNFDTRYSYCRLYSNEEISHMQSNPFGKSDPTSPIISIYDDQITVWKDERFILKGLDLKYIRKPQRLSLPLNQSYGIRSQKAIDKIIDMTVQYFHAAIQSGSYQTMVNENIIRD